MTKPPCLAGQRVLAFKKAPAACRGSYRNDNGPSLPESMVDARRWLRAEGSRPNRPRAEASPWPGQASVGFAERARLAPLPVVQAQAHAGRRVQRFPQLLGHHEGTQQRLELVRALARVAAGLH